MASMLFVVDAVVQAVVLGVMLEAFEKSKTYKPKVQWLTDNWHGIAEPVNAVAARITGLPIETLKEVGGC